MPIRGKMLEDGGVTEDKLASAVKSDLIWSDGRNDLSSNLSAAGNKITSLAAPASPGDAARYEEFQLVLEKAEEFRWVLCYGYSGNLTAANINLLTPATDDTYVVTAPGTITLGSFAVVAGDVVQYNGSIWVKQISGSAGFVPADTRLTISTTSTLVSPLTGTLDEGKYADFDGTTNTPTLRTPRDGDTMIIRGDSALNTNTMFVFNGAAPTGIWVIVQAALSTLGVGDGLDSSSNIVFIKPDGDSVSVSAAGVKAGVQKIETGVPANTSGDADDSGLDVGSTPAGNCYPAVFINGVQALVATTAGEKLTADCYFSVDGGSTARATSAITAADSLYWNGVLAGYDLETTDEVAIVYSVIL